MYRTFIFAKKKKRCDMNGVSTPWFSMKLYNAQQAATICFVVSGVQLNVFPTHAHFAIRMPKTFSTQRLALDKR